MEFTKECKHIYRDCGICTVVNTQCQKDEKTHPSCIFKNYCDYTKRECDEKCESNKNEFNINAIKEDLSKLNETKEFIEKLIKEKQYELTSLETIKKNIQENSENEK